jgi:hypothetical protein
MPKFTARQLHRALNEAAPEFRPLNMGKWRLEIRDIRNQLIKLRDRADDELERIRGAYDEDMGQRAIAEQEKMEDKLDEAIDAIAEAINQLDILL